MISKQVATRKIGSTEGFRWRGEEISRIEGLSDAVFAFSVTLLIVSLDVPKTLDDLVLTLKGFLPFCVCFVQLMGVWYIHYTYYRRYNLQDFKSIVFTMILLFLVLFYTYPLKFVFMTLFTQILGPMGPGENYALTSTAQLRELFTIYAIGCIAVFGMFALMYRHAYQSRHLLRLTELELWDTKHVIREMIAYCGVALLSLTLADTLPAEWVPMAGFSYSLMGLVGMFHGDWSGKRRNEIFLRLYPMESNEQLVTS